MATDKMKIGGLRFTPSLVQLTVRYGTEGEARIQRVLEQLNRLQVNVPLMCCMKAADTGVASIYIDKRHISAVSRQIDPSDAIAVKTGVGALSVFPHRSDVELLTAVLAAFGRRQCPLYALASSLSTLTFTTDDARLQEMADTLTRWLDVPDGATDWHPPPGPSDTAPALATTAMYREDKILTYGFDLRRAAAVVDGTWSPDDPAFPGMLRDPGNAPRTLTMVAGLADADGGMRLRLVFRAVPADRRRRMDAVTFQGPHFGDRCGIAHAAFAALAAIGVGPTTVCCTAASVGLAVPQGAADNALAGLSGFFATPPAVPARRKPKAAAVTP